MCVHSVHGRLREGLGPTQAAEEHEVGEEAPELPFLVHKSGIEVDVEGCDDLQAHLPLVAIKGLKALSRFPS